MFACVLFTEDLQPAVLPTELIKDFHPKNATDFSRQRAVSAYWRSEAGDVEGFYPAHVTALSDSLPGLTQALKKSRFAVPRVILAEVTKTAMPPKSLTQKERAAKRKQAARRELGGIIEAFNASDRSLELPNCDDLAVAGPSMAQGDGMGPEECAELRRLQDKVAALEAALLEQQEGHKKEVAALEEQVREQRCRADRLCDALLEKIEIARDAVGPDVVAEFSLPDNEPTVRSSTPTAQTQEPGPYDVLASCSFEGEDVILTAGHSAATWSERSERDRDAVAAKAVASGSHLHDGGTSAEAVGLPAASRTASVERQQESLPPLFAVKDGEVHLGSGHLVKEAKFGYIMASRAPARVARELARNFRSAKELQAQTLTGQSHRQEPGGVASLPATPTKVEAIMCVVQKVVHDNPCDEPPAKRIARGRKALRDLFAERGRLMHLKTPGVPAVAVPAVAVPAVAVPAVAVPAEETQEGALPAASA
ncbi:uncharacterized protein LOC144172659 [Haemaphysalis longicornis]